MAESTAYFFVIILNFIPIISESKIFESEILGLKDNNLQERFIILTNDNAKYKN